MLQFWCPEKCKRCGYMSSNDLCKACSLLEGLERGMSTAAIVRHTVPLLYLSPILFSAP
jgi:Zinc-ribbon